MPQQQNVVTVPSDAIQGEGSWVKLRKLTVGEAKQVTQVADTTDLKTASISLEVSTQLIADHVIDWNWGDPAGTPLPSPKDKPEVIDLLTADELAFLATALVGDQAKKKP
jgi:hypothetical protein